MTAGQASERIEFFRPSDMPGIDILRAENCARRWRAFHETYSVCTSLKGKEAEWIYRHRTHVTSAGDLMLMEPGEVHANTKITPLADFRVLLIAPSVIGNAAKEIGLASSQPHLKFANLTDSQVFGFFAQFHANLELGSSLLERQSCLAACIRILLERCAEAPLAIPRRPRVHLKIERAREFIREHFRDAISLDDLAIAASLSRYHLVRAFTSAYGLSPHAFQIHVRVEKARLLLASGISPAMVAADMGFADQSHFTRHFKRIWRTTPGSYALGAR